MENVASDKVDIVAENSWTNDYGCGDGKSIIKLRVIRYSAKLNLSTLFIEPGHIHIVDITHVQFYTERVR